MAQAATGDFAIDDMLSELCHAAASALGADGVGVMAVDGTRTRFVQSSHPQWTPFEVLQQILQAGPCRDAVNSGRPVVADRPGRIATMWGTDFANAASRSGIRSVLAMPLLSRGQCWGTLDIYWKGEHTPNDGELAAAHLLANVAVSYLVMAADRDEARSSREQLAHQVLHDDLTGLANRQLIHELIQHALDVAVRHNTDVGVVFIDLDKFKQVNDRHGHLAGDLVLKDVAGRLVRSVRTGDSVARLSGDEFIVLCEDLPSRHDEVHEAMAALVERISAAIAAPIPIATHMLHVTASIGYAVASTTPGAGPVDLIHHADLVMYQSKQHPVTSLPLPADHHPPSP